MAETNIVNADAYRKNRAAVDLLNWLDTQRPGTKAEIIGQIGSPGLGATDNTPWYTKAIEAAGQVANTYFQGKVQKETTDLQIERARQGLPPLDLSQYGAAPITTQVDVKMSPQVKTMIWVGGGLLAAIILLPLLTGKRR